MQKTWYNVLEEATLLESNDLARIALDAIENKKGSHIILLDIRPVSILADHFIICTGETDRQIKAIVEEIQGRLAKVEALPLRIEGVPESGWVLMDYGGLVIHVFDPEQRAYYQLEDLWKDATRVVTIQ